MEDCEYCAEPAVWITTVMDCEVMVCGECAEHELARCHNEDLQP